MANEAVLIYETSIPIPFTAAAALEKGSYVKIIDPATVAITAADHDAVIGITAEEITTAQVAAGQKVPVYLSGIFRGIAGTAGVTASLAIDMDTGTSAANKLADAAVNSEHIVGRALETAAAGESFLFYLNPYNTNLA